MLRRIELSEEVTALSVKCARAVTPKVVDVWIAYVKKLFQESGQCGHVSKDFSNRPWNCNVFHI